MMMTEYMASVIEARVLEALVEDNELDERTLDKLPLNVVELFGALEGEGVKLYRDAISKGGQGGGGGGGFGSLSDHDQKRFRAALEKAAKGMELDAREQKQIVDYAIRSITQRAASTRAPHYVGGREPMAASLDSARANLTEVKRRGETVTPGKDFGGFSTFSIGDDEGTAYKAKTADGKVVPIIMRGEKGKGGAAEVIVPGGKRVMLSLDQASKLKDAIGQYDMAEVPALVKAVASGRKLPEGIELDEATTSWELNSRRGGWEVLHTPTKLGLGFVFHRKTDATRLMKLLPEMHVGASGHLGQSSTQALRDVLKQLDIEDDPKHKGMVMVKQWPASEDVELIEVSPPGFEGTVLAMKKKHKDIENPWALAWWMRGKGDESHYKVKRGKPVRKKEEAMSDCGCGGEPEDCGCDDCAKSRTKKGKSEGLSGDLSSAMGESSRSGQWFVIIDKKTGKAVGSDIFTGTKTADAALDKMGGEKKTGYQVMDAMFHNPSRAKLKAMGWIGEGRESGVGVDAHADPGDAGYEPAYALPPGKPGETTVNVNAAVAAIIDDVVRDNKTAKPETVDPLGIAKVSKPTQYTAEGKDSTTADWGNPYGESPAYETRHGLVWMRRKGQKVRFFDKGGKQVGPEQPNVAPAMAYANKQDWAPADPRMKALHRMAKAQEPDLFPKRESIYDAVPGRESIHDVAPDERVSMAEAYDRMVAGSDLDEAGREAAELYERLVISESVAKKVDVSDDAFEAALVMEGALTEEQEGHHFFDGKSYFVDTAFLGHTWHPDAIIKGMELKHMGMGEFELSGPAGRIDFDRMRGKDFPGMSGRSHKVYDDKGGKLVKELIAAMEKKKRSELVKESLDEGRAAEPFSVGDHVVFHAAKAGQTATSGPRSGERGVVTEVDPHARGGSLQQVVVRFEKSGRQWVAWRDLKLDAGKKESLDEGGLDPQGSGENKVGDTDVMPAKDGKFNVFQRKADGWKKVAGPFDSAEEARSAAAKVEKGKTEGLSAALASGIGEGSEDEKMSQAQHLQKVQRRSARGNDTMLDLLYGKNPISDEELKKLIAKNPHVYGKYKNYLGKRGRASEGVETSGGELDEAAKLKGKKLDAEINRLFKQHGNNIQFHIMDLGKIHKAGADAAASGEDIEAAVVAAIQKYKLSESGGKKFSGWATNIKSGKKLPVHTVNARDEDDAVKQAKGIIAKSGGKPGDFSYEMKLLRAVKEDSLDEDGEHASDLTEATNGKVGTFLTILSSHLTQYDKKQIASETKRGGRGNIHRLSLLFGALGKVRDDVKDVEGSDSPEAMEKLKASLGKRFNDGFPPVTKLVKQIDAFVSNGKLPKITVQKSNEDIDLDEATEMAKPSFHAGSRVKFSPAAMRASMYREYHPKKGEMGTVVSNEYGRWPSDSSKKASGAVKVKWDKAGLQTVHPEDAEITGGKSAKAEDSGFAGALGHALL